MFSHYFHFLFALVSLLHCKFAVFSGGILASISHFHPTALSTVSTKFERGFSLSLIHEVQFEVQSAACVCVTSIMKFSLSSVQVLAYVSQVHKVVLPVGVVDNESLTLEQVSSSKRGIGVYLLIIFKHLHDCKFLNLSL